MARGGPQEAGLNLFAAADRLDLEGIVAKQKTDAYRPETVWYKIKSRTYTQGEGRWELFQKRAFALSAWFIGLAYFFSASLPLFSTCSGRPRYTGRGWGYVAFVGWMAAVLAIGLWWPAAFPGLTLPQWAAWLWIAVVAAIMLPLGRYVRRTIARAA